MTNNKFTENEMMKGYQGGIQKYMGIKSYKGIDLFKFFAAIVVIAIHTNPFEKCNIELIVRCYNFLQVCAVPLFFLFSGFLLGERLGISKCVGE